MASGANVKIGVDVTQFRQGMQQAQQSAKTLQTQMKANEAQFKATGDKEQYLTEKGKLLKAELEAQKKAAENAEKALEAMKEKGVSETSAEYQKMAQQLAGIQTAMYNTQTAMNNMTVSETKASSGAKDLSTNLNSIAKNVSFDMVIKGIDTITTSMEKAGKKAVEVGKQIWDNITDSAKWADDAATMATMYEVPLERYLQMEALVATGLDTSVEAVLTAQQKLRKGLGNKNESVLDVFDQLNVRLYKIDHSGHKVMRDMDDLFWEAGQAIMGMDDAFDREAAAQAIFGRSWRELIPLFEQFQDKDSFNAALDEQNTVSEESVEKLAELNDKISELEHNFFVLKTEVLASLAPALSSAADSISQMLVSLTEYLQSDAGQEQLQKLGDAFGQIVEGIMNFDAEAAVKGVVDVLTKIKDAFAWISENWNSVKLALETIAGAFLLFKATQGILAVIQLINGLRGLGGGEGIANAVSGVANKVNGVNMKTPGASDGNGTGTTPVPSGNGTGTPGTPTTNPAQNGSTATPVTTVTAETVMFDTKMGQAAATGFVLGEMWDRYWEYQDKRKQTNAEIDAYGINLSTPEAQEELRRIMTTVLDPGEKQAAYAAMAEKYGTVSPEEAKRQREEIMGIYDTETERLCADIDNAINSLKALTQTVDRTKFAFGAAGGRAAWGFQPGMTIGHAGGNYGANVEMTHANGIWSVPWDGYPAILHKGERVVPYRGDSYTSNVYFGSVNLNNGLEVEALTESIDRRNRRMRAGYGS